MDEQREHPASDVPERDPPGPEHLLTRRALFGTVFGGVSTVALLNQFSGSGNNRPRSAMQEAATPSPETTVPSSSATASPVASPEPVQEMIGSLKVVRGDVFAWDEEPQPSDTLTILIDGNAENENFNPAAFRQDFQITASYLDPLVWIDDVTMEPRPWLATKWAWDESGRSVTFTLREDVRWHNGERFRSRDVAFSWEVYRDDIDSNARNLFTQLESVELIDPFTVKANLLTPDGNWLLNAATQPIFLRKQYIDHWKSRPIGERTLSDFSWSSETPVGTGPWKMGRRRSIRIEFDRNDNYFGGAPNFTELHLAFADSREERISRWIDGESDILAQVSVQDINAVQDVPATLYASNGVQVMFAAFNFDNLTRAFPQLLGDIRIRRALSLAVNRRRNQDEIFRSFLRGYAAGSVAQPWAHDASIKSPEQDLEEARSLLKAAGLSDLNNDGILEDFNGSPLSFTAIVRADANPLLIQIVSGLADDFRQLGVKMNARILAPDQFQESWTVLRDWDFIAYSYALYPGFTDYDLYGSNYDIRINPQGWNPGGYANDQVDSYIKRILITTELDRQTEILGQLQETVNEDLFGLWFGFPDDLVLVRPDIMGYTPNKYLTSWNTRLLWRGME